MSLHLIVPPVEAPVSLAVMRAQTRLGDEDEDPLLSGYIRAATNALDGAYGWLGRALVTQTWELRLDEFPWHGAIHVPLPPCQSITSIVYVDTDGAEQTLASYQVAGLDGSRRARIVPAFGERWPATRCQPDAVRVRFVAGYGDHETDIPEAIRQGIMLIAAVSFDDRWGEVGITPAAESLLFPFRVW